MNTRTVVISFPQGMSSQSISSVLSEIDRITAHCEVDGYCTFLFPARGPTRYFGGEDALAQHIHSVMQSLFPDDSCGIGIGDSRFIARLASIKSWRVEHPVIISPRDTLTMLRALPVKTLVDYGHIADDVVQVFQHLGLHTLGHVADLGETALIDRFGNTGKHVFAIATGADVEMFVPVVGHDSLSVVCDFDNMVGHSLSDAMNDLRIVVTMADESIGHFEQQLFVQGLQCLQLRISCETEHGERSERTWWDMQGFRKSSIVERLDWQLRHWFTKAHSDEHPTSWISTVTFEALQCRVVSAENVTLWDVRADSTERVMRALSRAAIADEEVLITVPVWKGGRDVSTFDAMSVSQVDLHNHNTVIGDGIEWNGSVPAPRPITLCDPGIAISLHDGLSVPVFVTGRHELSSTPAYARLSRGATWNVISWAGPWPVEERWWDPHRWKRHAYLQVLAQSRDNTVVWLLSVESRQWKIVGLYH